MLGLFVCYLKDMCQQSTYASAGPRGDFAAAFEQIKHLYSAAASDHIPHWVSNLIVSGILALFFHYRPSCVVVAVGGCGLAFVPAVCALHCV